jgi:prolyl 4-hydroxylase
MNNVDPLSEIRALLASGRVTDGAESLSLLAEAGNHHALYELALWAITGNIVPRDLGLARSLLGRASDAGHDEAAFLYANFLASGIGGDTQWEPACDLLRKMEDKIEVASDQLRLIDTMELGANGNPARRHQLELASNQPQIAVCRQLLTSEECEYVVAKGAPHLSPSNVVDPDTGRLIPHPVRRSQGAMFGVYTEDLIISAINRRVATLSGTAYEQGEPLQLLQYQNGDEYRPHLDALPGEQNQRIMTVIMYLSDAYEGGETEFLRTGFSFKGRKGDALLFANVLPNGQPDPLSLHCGRPVVRGTKSIATRWIRKARFIYPPPKPLLENFRTMVP